MATAAPSAASRIAVALPMPLEAPVIRACRPWSMSRSFAGGRSVGGIGLGCGGRAGPRRRGAGSAGGAVELPRVDGGLRAASRAPCGPERCAVAEAAGLLRRRRGRRVWRRVRRRRGGRRPGSGGGSAGRRAWPCPRTGGRPARRTGAGAALRCPSRRRRDAARGNGWPAASAPAGACPRCHPRPVRWRDRGREAAQLPAATPVPEDRPAEGSSRGGAGSRRSLCGPGAVGDRGRCCPPAPALCDSFRACS
ncbi:hypothetical protein SAMN05661080_04701 [Modestobacter sp. DSM 44400]|nr:hypothetical protein SAMN05661080_04701 [Modestobacter sp. DSM 44400]